MKIILHEADTRGYFDHGWLQTHHTFSFADYFNSRRMHFGALRVLNDDRIAPGTGFGTHSHRDMEIVTVPLAGALEHRDNMGNVAQLKTGQIQVMSAGTGVTHSEYSVSGDRPTELLQIWVMPERQGVAPRYQDSDISNLIIRNTISEIVYPYPGREAAEKGNGLWIHQQAWFSIAELDKDARVTYHLHTPESLGVYLFMIKGRVDAAEYTLKQRDGMGIMDALRFDIKAIEASTVLLIEVPPFSK